MSSMGKCYVCALQAICIFVFDMFQKFNFTKTYAFHKSIHTEFSYDCIQGGGSAHGLTHTSWFNSTAGLFSHRPPL